VTVELVAAPICFRRVGDRFVVTTDAGDFAFVDEAELAALVRGDLPPGTRRDELTRKGLLPVPEGLAHSVRKLREKRSFLDAGPNLHIVVVTLRCDHRCVYCHASRAGMHARDVDMSEETARRVVETAMSTTSPAVTIELQGGEPLAHFDRVRQVVDMAISLARDRGKTLDLSLVTGMTLMDDKKAEFLLDRRVQICTSLDGPQDLHDSLRPRKDGSSHALVVEWIEKLNRAYRDRGLDPDLYHVDALVTVARPSLGRARDIIDEYIRLGLKTIHLRPLNPLGLARRNEDEYGYGPREFLEFYREGLRYLVRKNLDGLEILEKMTSVFLKKVLEDRDPGFLDIRSPCGGGIGQLAYDFDGSVYTCDEGRMLARMGDPAFRVGRVDETPYQAMMTSPATRIVCLASCLEGSAACLACAYRPYCGTCPVLSYSQQGDPFGVIPATDRCQIHKGVLDEIFRMLIEGGDDVRAVLERWTLTRPRPELIHGPAPSC
jgi:His-Xaa-Ser system radical SAM maturase HxsB